MKKNIILLVTLLLSGLAFSQVGIDTETPKATLDVTGKPDVSSKTDGIIAPRLTGDQLKAKDDLYNADQNGTIIFATSAVSSTSPRTINMTSRGYYYFDSAKGTLGEWVKFGANSGSSSFSDCSKSYYLKMPSSAAADTRLSSVGTNAANMPKIGGKLELDFLACGLGCDVYRPRLINRSTETVRVAYQYENSVSGRSSSGVSLAPGAELNLDNDNILYWNSSSETNTTHFFVDGQYYFVTIIAVTDQSERHFGITVNCGSGTGSNPSNPGIGTTYTASNGLTMNSTDVQLGGTLNQATSIVTSSANTLALTGLQTGGTTDKMMVVDATTGVIKTVNQPPVIESPALGTGTVIAINGQLKIAQEITLQLSDNFTTNNYTTPVAIGNLTNELVDNENTFTGTASNNSFTVKEDGVYSITINAQARAKINTNPVIGVYNNTDSIWVARVNDAFVGEGINNTYNLQTYTLITAIEMSASKVYSFRMITTNSSAGNFTILQNSEGSTGSAPVTQFTLRRLK